MPETTTTLAPPEQTDQPNWTEGLDSDTVGFLQNRGWDKLSANEATQEAIKAYRNAQKLTGAPPEQLLRLPKDDADLGEKQAFWRRLGAPDKPDGYDFTGMEWDDADKTARFTEAIRKTAVELNIPKEMTERLAKSFYDWGAKETSDGEAQLTIRRQGEERELYQAWGEPNSPTYRANNFIVDRALEKLGIDQPKAEALRAELGLKGFAEMFHRIGQAMGEDKFVTADPPGSGNRMPMTREQIEARLNDLKTDASWRERLFKGDKAVKQEFLDLTAALARR
jgi:hypothetical protein